MISAAPPASDVAEVVAHLRARANMCPLDAHASIAAILLGGGASCCVVCGGPVLACPIGYTQAEWGRSLQAVACWWCRKGLSARGVSWWELAKGTIGTPIRSSASSVHMVTLACHLHGLPLPHAWST